MNPKRWFVMFAALLMVAVTATASVAAGDKTATADDIVKALNTPPAWSADYPTVPDAPAAGLPGGYDTGDVTAQGTVTRTINTINDSSGCTDGNDGDDIKSLTVEQQDDGNWRFTVEVCAAKDFTTKPTGWQMMFYTSRYTSGGTSYPVMTYYGDIYHNKYTTLLGATYWEPSIAMHYNDQAVTVLPFFTTGRPDTATPICNGFYLIYDSPDRFYTPTVSAATSFTFDIWPGCWDSHTTISVDVESPTGDTLDSAKTLLIGDMMSGRLAGSDRFRTAVAISRRSYPMGGRFLWGDVVGIGNDLLGGKSAATRVVYLADGFGFPDALGAGTVQGLTAPDVAGPILFWNSILGVVPDPTLGEICRIHPSQVIALGGTSVVSNAALAAAMTAAKASDCSVYGI